MSNADIVKMLRLDLQNPPGALDEYLAFLVRSAQEQIAEKGITLDGSTEDAHLVVMYASWMYRRRNNIEGMPRMLQYALHSRLIREKGGVNGNVTG